MRDHMQPVASGFGPVALKMEFKKMRSDPVAFCDRLQNRTGPDFKTLVSLSHRWSPPIVVPLAPR